MDLAGMTIAVMITVFVMLLFNVCIRATTNKLTELNCATVRRHQSANGHIIILVKDGREYKLKFSREQWLFLEYGCVVNVKYDSQFHVRELHYFDIDN